MTRLAYRSTLAVLAALLVLSAASQALAKPESLLTGVIKGLEKRGTILDIRKCIDDKTYELVINENGVIKMWRLPANKPSVQLHTVRTYDLEKLKQLKGSAKKANDVMLKNPEVKNVRPVIRAITIRENDAGEFEFLVSTYHPADGSYRKSFVIDPKTWTILPDTIQLDPEPRDEIWSEEEAREKGVPVPKAPEKPGAAAAEPKAPESSDTPKPDEAAE